MRQIAVLIFVVVASASGLVLPQWGLWSYLFFGLLRPDVIAYMGPNPYSSMLAITALLGSLRFIGNVFNILLNPFSLAFLALQIPIALSVAFSLDQQAVLPKYMAFLQMSLMLLLIPLLIDDLKTVRMTLMALALGIGLLGFKFGSWGLFLGGVRFHAGASGFHADNNSLALGLVTGFPLCWAMAQLSEKKWHRIAFFSMGVFSIATVFMTHSRGGILSLVLPIFLFILRSKRKSLALVLVVLICLPAPLLIWDSLVQRMGTLEAPLEEQSAASRYDLNKAAIGMIKDYPWLGIGFGGEVFAQISGRYLENSSITPHVAHNNYLQMWADSGVGAFVIYCAMLFGAITWLGRVYRRNRETEKELATMCSGLQLSLIGFAVGSTFVSRTNYDFIYMLLLLTGSMYLAVKRAERLAAQSASAWGMEQVAANDTRPTDPVPAGTEHVVPGVAEFYSRDGV